MECMVADLKTRELLLYKADTGVEKARKFVFINENSFDDFVDFNTLSIGFDADDGEEVDSITEETDKYGNLLLHITTKLQDPEKLKEYCDIVRYPHEDLQEEDLHYLVRADSFEIISMNSEFIKKDGTSEPLSYMKVTADAKTPEVPDIVYEKTVKGDQRTLTLTVDPGTDKCRVITETVTKGADFYIFDADALYVDEACTKLFEEDTDKNSDLTLYCHSNN